MTYTLLLKFEVILLLLSGGYILFYIWNYITRVFLNVKKIVSPSTTVNTKNWTGEEENKNIIKVTKNEWESLKREELKKEKKLSEDEKNKLLEVIKKVRVNTSKSYYEAAKSLIVEGLAIDKFNRELNLELAQIYEAEKNYKNAEYICRDLVELHNDNYEILKKLGYILALQKRFNESIEMYEQAHEKNKWDLDVVDLLTDLHYEIGSFEWAYKYVVLSLKQKPRNVDRLVLKAELCLREGKEDEAILSYREVLEMQPYNTDAMDGLRSLGQKLK